MLQLQTERPHRQRVSSPQGMYVCAQERTRMRRLSCVTQKEACSLLQWTTLICKHSSLRPWTESPRVLHELYFCLLQRHRTCYLCAALDHVSSSCPQDLCSYCYRPKHRGRVSPVWPHSRPLWIGLTQHNVDNYSLIPRPLPPPVLDHFQYANMEGEGLVRKTQGLNDFF